MNNLPHNVLDSDDRAAFVLVCSRMIDYFKNGSDPSSPGSRGAISGYKRLLDKSHFNSPYTSGEIKNVIIVCDMFLSDMRQTISFMDDPALRAETRIRIRQVEGLRSKLSPET